MGYGEKTLSDKEKADLQNISESLTIAPRHRQFEEPEHEMRVPLDLSGMSREQIKAQKEAYQRAQTQTADSAIQRVLESAKKQDKQGEEMKELTTFSSKATWLLTRTIPTNSEIEGGIDDATKTFKIASLSDSQKTKRGQKFKKKAVRQAKMINIMNQCHWQREEALENLLKHGKNARYGTDVSAPVWDVMGKQTTLYRDKEKAAFLENVGEDLDEVSVQMRDISFYFEQKRGSKDQEAAEPPKPLTGVSRYDEKQKKWVDIAEEQKEEALHPVTRYHYKPLELIADPKTRTEGYKKVLEELEKLDLSIFDYKDNEEFMKDEGEKSFVKRYASLRAFSHAQDMIRAVGRAELGDAKYIMLSAKADIILDILKDYNSRAILLQSPYYVLLAEKDFDDLSADDLKERIDNTKDILAKNYMEQILERRGTKRFKKGSSANEILIDSVKTLSYRTERDKTGSAAMQEKLKKYNEDYTPDDSLVSADRSAHSGFKAGIRRLASLLFRKKSALPVIDGDEKELEKKYEEDKNEQGDGLSLEKWVNDRQLEVFDNYVKAASAADQSYFSLTDSKSYFKRELLTEAENMINAQKNGGEFRKDYTGALRKGHLKKYKKGGKFNETLVEEDVNNLVNNLIADDLLDEKDVDLSMLEEELVTYLNGYTLFAHYKEGCVLEPMLEEKRCETQINNIDELLKQKPENRMELEEELKQLKEEKKIFTCRKKISDAFVLKVKNKTEVIKKYWVAKKKMKAIMEAERMLDKEEAGVYLDSMRNKLEKLKNEQQEILDYNMLLFREPIHTTLKVPDPFTKAQSDILSSLAQTALRIDELKKEGKKGEEEAMKLLEEARSMMETYEDPEYEKRLGIKA